MKNDSLFYRSLIRFARVREKKRKKNEIRFQMYVLGKLVLITTEDECNTCTLREDEGKAGTIYTGLWIKRTIDSLEVS